MALFRGVKTAFDPRGILNPGVKLATGLDPLGALKLGPGAAEIPADASARERVYAQVAERIA